MPREKKHRKSERKAVRAVRRTEIRHHEHLLTSHGKKVARERMSDGARKYEHPRGHRRSYRRSEYGTNFF